jgi:hypothetical protein
MLVIGPSSQMAREASFAAGGGLAPCLADVQWPPLLLLLLTRSACVSSRGRREDVLLLTVRSPGEDGVLTCSLVLIEEEEKMCYSAAPFHRRRWIWESERKGKKAIFTFFIYYASTSCIM